MTEQLTIKKHPPQATCSHCKQLFLRHTMTGVVLDEGAAFALSVVAPEPLQANTFMLLCPACFKHYNEMWPTLTNQKMLNLKSLTTQMTMQKYACDKCHSEIHGVYELHGQRVALCMNKNNEYSDSLAELLDLGSK